MWKFCRRPYLALVTLGTCLSAISPGAAWGFSEDLCQIVHPNAPRQGKLLNCYDIKCNDNLEFGTFKSMRCTAKQFVAAGLLTVELLPVRGRSMIHFDSTYLIAQALGMSAKDAYWLAAYDQATDQGSYQAYDAGGHGIPAYTTYEIPGVNRLHMEEGGTFFHFVPPLNPTRVTEKFDVNDPNEAPLHHVRDWAFGKRETLCRYGLASKPFTDAPGCYAPPGLLEPIRFSFPKTSADDSPQALTNVKAGEIQLAPTPLPADLLPVIKLGVYLHTLADRLSHHECTDAAPLVLGPDGRFEATFRTAACSQGAHVFMHAFEQGHKELPARTRLALEGTYDEINAWLQEHPAFRKEKPLGVSRDQLVADLLLSLQPEKAPKRLKAFRKLWDTYKVCGLPGDEAKNRVCYPDVKVEQDR